MEIQDAIVAATDGDRVVLAPGVHMSSSTIDFLGKSIEVLGASGPADTELQFLAGNGVIFQSGEGRDAVLRGVKIIQGRVACFNASPSLIDVWILESDNAGLGVHGVPPHPDGTLVQGCWIHGCTGESAGGASITAPAQFIGCSIESNTVSGTFPQGRGGGMKVDLGSSAEILRLENCLIRDNLAASTLSVGGGLFLESGTVEIVNCTIVGNEAFEPEGGGILVLFADATIRNTIVYGNTGGGQPSQIDSSASIDLAYSNVEDGWPGTGNIDVDPQFVLGPLGANYLDLGSPCVNSGDPALPLIDGTTRVDQLPDDDVVDMGYHYPIIDDRFVRGDCNADGQFDLADAVFSLSALFVAGSDEPTCESACDGNDDDSIDISDPIFSLSALLVLGSPRPTAPFPACGPDPTLGQLECVTFAPCP